MKRIDYINGLDFDFELWYFDGEYVGHDNQIEPYDFVPRGSTENIEFHHRVPRDDIDPQDLLSASVESLEALEPFLEPEGA